MRRSEVNKSREGRGGWGGLPQQTPDSPSCAGISTTPTLVQVLIMDPAQSAVPQLPAPPSGVQRVAGGAAHGRDDADVVRRPYPEVRDVGARRAAGPQLQELPRPPRGIEQHRTGE